MEFSHFLSLCVPFLEVCVKSQWFIQQIFTGPQLFNTEDAAKKKHKNPALELCTFLQEETDDK